MDDRRDPNDVFGALVLIGFCSLLLLCMLWSMNIIHFSIWRIFVHLWPLILIAAGLNLIVGGRSTVGSAIAGMLILGLFVAGIWFIQTQEPFQRTLPKGYFETLGTVNSASVRIDPGMALLYIGGCSGDELITHLTPYGISSWLDYEFCKTGNSAAITMSLIPDGWLPGRYFLDSDGSWEVRLNRAVKYNLTVDMDVGSMVADLSGFQIDQMQFDLGIGYVKLILPEEGKADVHVDSGIGSVIISIPENLSARIITDTVLVSKKLPARYTRSGGVYYSPDYSEDANSVDVYIDLVMGFIIIKHTGEH